LDVKRIQDIIDEKLRMRDLISKVVEEKLSQRQAIEELVKMRLSQMLLESSSFSDKKNDLEEEEKEKEKEEEAKKEKELKMEKKLSKLKQFLERKAAKKSKPSYEIRIEKSESVICPDCGNKIFDEKSGFSGCVCFGPDRNKKIHIKKSENGIKLSFSKQWDPENIEMLLEVLRERRNRSKNG
jgi:glycosylphosphatidylinositol transamidase (GPIT) subunit GPI8